MFIKKHITPPRVKDMILHIFAHNTLSKEKILKVVRREKRGLSIITEPPNTIIYFKYDFSSLLNVNFLFSTYPFKEYRRNDIMLNAISSGPLYVLKIFIRIFTIRRSKIILESPTKL
ncbi:MAG: hypothetical protein E6X21_02875 [Clostridium sp.]|nr:hypothetical protein [Clostridium cadaveris]MDU4951263.1 hypothetical protein [Clostridium sp.]